MPQIAWSLPPPPRGGGGAGGGGGPQPLLASPNAGLPPLNQILLRRDTPDLPRHIILPWKSAVRCSVNARRHLRVVVEPSIHPRASARWCSHIRTPNLLPPLPTQPVALHVFRPGNLGTLARLVVVFVTFVGLKICTHAPLARWCPTPRAPPLQLKRIIYL